MHPHTHHAHLRSSGYLETCDHLQYDYRQFEITQLVGTLDHHWSRFLLVASGLKEGVNVRSFSNLNSMVEYRLDLTVLFDEMLQVVRYVYWGWEEGGVKSGCGKWGAHHCGACLHVELV